MELECQDGLKSAVQVTLTHYRKVEDHKTEMERHLNVEHEDTKQKAHDCREEVKIDQKLDAYTTLFI